jgi:hypothetical protein
MAMELIRSGATVSSGGGLMAAYRPLAAKHAFHPWRIFAL